MNPALMDIERIVKRGLRSLRNCLWDDPECYWPQEGEQNGLPERNLSIHVGHRFLADGWIVFAEPSFPGRTDRRIDFMALKRGVLVTAECKQLDMSDRSAQFAHDIRGLKSFRLTKAWNNKEYQAPKVTRRIGVLLANTWSFEVQHWWKGSNHVLLPDGRSGPGWKALRTELRKFDEPGCSVFGVEWLNRPSETDEPDFWALYAMFEL